MQSSSEYIFRATRGRASFGQVEVLVPSQWTPSVCSLLQGRLKPATSHSWLTADLRVTHKRHPDFGPRPWTLQSRGCAQQGDYVSLGHEILFQNETDLNGKLNVPKCDLIIQISGNKIFVKR